MARGDDIQLRLVRLGVQVLDLCDGLPATAAGKHISGQLLRSGTAGAPNYAEARGAESTNDFIHKLGIVLKELNETEIWLIMVGQRQMVPEEMLQSVQQECKELCRIIAVSRRTARERRNN
jgi:four helix bundle protein